MGLFPLMTVQRPEIIVEGSTDKCHWRDYVFQYKPGPLVRSLTVLLEHNPFPRVPAKYVRAMAFDYRFTSLRERAASGCWWARRLSGMYYPPTALSSVKRTAPPAYSLLDSVLRPR
jgi:hypothetical protein